MIRSTRLPECRERRECRERWESGASEQSRSGVVRWIGEAVE